HPSSVRAPEPARPGVIPIHPTTPLIECRPSLRGRCIEIRLLRHARTRSGRFSALLTLVTVMTIAFVAYSVDHQRGCTACSPPRVRTRVPVQPGWGFDPGHPVPHLNLPPGGIDGAVVVPTQQHPVDTIRGATLGMFLHMMNLGAPGWGAAARNDAAA